MPHVHHGDQEFPGIDLPHGHRMVLTGDLQELYASMMGGRLIKGKAVTKDGNIEAIRLEWIDFYRN